MIQTGSTQTITSPRMEELQQLCPGQEVNITCKAIGDQHTIFLSWRSEEYIGSGGVELAFATFDSVGTNKKGVQSKATLIKKEEQQNGLTVLESKLFFVARVDSNITCSSGRTTNPLQIRIVHSKCTPVCEKCMHTSIIFWLLAITCFELYSRINLFTFFSWSRHASECTISA